MYAPETLNADVFNARSRAARKSTLVSVVVNILLSLIQIAVGIFSGSQGLIADGIHSLSDLVADVVVLIASFKSCQPSDSDHHYGHWRYENGASMILGTLLFLWVWDSFDVRCLNRRIHSCFVIYHSRKYQ